MEDYKVPPPGVMSIPIHLLLSVGGSVVYAPGDDGTSLPVGDTVRIEVIRRDPKLKRPDFRLAAAETNEIGDFMLQIPTPMFRIGKDNVLMQISEKGTRKSLLFNLGHKVNLRLTTQPQLIGPLIVFWGPSR